MPKRSIVFMYGIASYGVAMCALVYAMGFVANVYVPRSIDSPAAHDLTTALVVDAALLLAFAVQHSVMARVRFKAWLTRWIPGAAERSTFVLASAFALIAMFAFWQPLGGLLWRVVDPRLAWLLIGVSACGWLLVLLSTFMIDHFDLFGLRQVWNYLRGNERTTGTFRTPGAYRLIRHPLYAGFLIAFWATPAMTVAHTLFAVATTGYILVAIQLEERDLIANFGDTYRRYRTSVPMLLPFLRGPK